MRPQEPVQQLLQKGNDVDELSDSEKMPVPAVGPAAEAEEGRVVDGTEKVAAARAEEAERAQLQELELTWGGRICIIYTTPSIAREPIRACGYMVLSILLRVVTS